ncbi:hypothetical protein FIBSPDRAFT_425687 [Athelia psychrophila]|uniref:Secreted protein n=1 Tax=Athelia psychrophila TaxID=1759441 RepID=A0A166LDT6_9AGAM|nr:hypothetical protein FIBSPDRAFT_467817 [Fibularhizoctonia sp. CBS 109695]KZP24206.1 hypothetical protein FIBSPDRAFT_425687 [Fibularhizoctonia sp. CBS 109695]
MFYCLLSFRLSFFPSFLLSFPGPATDWASRTDTHIYRTLSIFPHLHSAFFALYCLPCHLPLTILTRYLRCPPQLSRTLFLWGYHMHTHTHRRTLIYHSHPPGPNSCDSAPVHQPLKYISL